MSLSDQTLFITGASRGIGREIALRAARDGANIVIAAKSATAHPKLAGTIHSVADEVVAAGGKALALQLDVRDEVAVKAALAQAAAHFGGIDAVINNAGAIKLANVETLEPKRFDLMFQVNTRAVMVVSQAALPYLKNSHNAHIVNLSPPLNTDPKWFADYGPYTTTKYGMSILTLGMHQEFARYGISVNSLWPKKIIATAAVEFEIGANLLAQARTPAIMADAAHIVLSSRGRSISGRLIIDEDLLREHGVGDFERYRAVDNGKPLLADLFVDD